jgi:hypothetical protein
LHAFTVFYRFVCVGNNILVWQRIVTNFLHILITEKLIVLLRDGRKLLGTLCSFDQFGMPLLHPLVLASIPITFSAINILLHYFTLQQMLFFRVLVNE